MRASDPHGREKATMWPYIIGLAIITGLALGLAEVRSRTGRSGRN